ncbi:MAG: IS1634 family transposase [Syntrophobacteria bacterium]
MVAIHVAMYIETVPNRNSPPAILLREGWREGSKVHKRTIANITHWPKEQVEALRRVLKGELVVSPEEAFAIERSIPHGHVEAILGTIRKLGLDRIIASKGSRQCNLVLAMIAERLMFPCSKLATTRLWHDSTLAEELGVADATENDLYAALDWLLRRQPHIENKLASRHLSEDSMVLYDVTSSYYDGRTCPLVHFGHSRDGKKGRPIIVYGLLTDKDGCPVSVEVYPGNTADPTTVPDQVDKLRKRFGIERVVLVGDRGMLTQTQIDKLKDHPGLGWISALRSNAIRKLADQGALQMSLFDERTLAEIHTPEFPAERLVACYNPLLAEERHRKREALLEATEKDLEKIVRDVRRRTKKPLDKVAISRRVGKVLYRYKMAKHFSIQIEDSSLSYSRKEESIKKESELDGIYVIRTSEPEERLSPEDVVRGYKRLSQVERAFRCMKGVEILIRPIFHRTEAHVRAHIFLCVLAYYVEYHMRKALKPLLFDDEELAGDRIIRDPVAPATPSASSKRKKRIRRTAEGFEVHSFCSLLGHLATRCRNFCRMKSEASDAGFHRVTQPTPLQEAALRMLGLFPVNGK